MTEHLRWVDQHREAVTSYDIELRQPECERALSLQMKNEALTKVKNVENQSGLEAWRQLVEEYEPHTRGRRRHALVQLLRAEPATSLDSVMSTIEEWEHRVCDHGARVDPLGEAIRAGVLTLVAPEAVQTHLYLIEATQRSSADVRRVIVDYIEAQWSTRPD